MTAPERAAAVYIGALVDELARCGVRHACIAPGSRSTPLALAIVRHPALRAWLHVDERSAAFFALGMARALSEPVALVCTSGTAAANFLPAVVEARHGGVPLLVLTADRPPELRDVAAPQAIDQARLYGTHAKWFVDLALPEVSPALLRYVRTVACRAVATARATPAGAVHLNLPLREPLVPVATAAPAGLSHSDALAWAGRADGAPWVVVGRPAPMLDVAGIDEFAHLAHGARRPIIVCGPQQDPLLGGHLASLAARLGAPVLADPLSQLRWSGEWSDERAPMVDSYDAFLRDETLAQELAPDLIIRIGSPPTSASLRQYMQRHGAVPQLVIAPAEWPDPMHVASAMLRADPSALCTAAVDRMGTAPRGDGAWLARWRELDGAAGAALDAHLAGVAESFEGRAIGELVALLPEGATLVVSSSMPVRDLDTFARGDRRRLRVIANRGANGIDGVVSTALGAAAARRAHGGGPVALAIGDLAFYHDMNGLLAARLHELDATILLLHNDGGGIFSFLPQATEAEAEFEQIFGTPHGLDFAPLAQLYGLQYTSAASYETLRAALGSGLRGRGVHVVELRTERARNVALHGAARRAVQAALGAGERAR